jgi:hypothetical protein
MGMTCRQIAGVALGGLEKRGSRQMASQGAGEAKLSTLRRSLDRQRQEAHAVAGLDAQQH